MLHRFYKPKSLQGFVFLRGSGIREVTMAPGLITHVMYGSAHRAELTGAPYGECSSKVQSRELKSSGIAIGRVSA